MAYQSVIHPDASVVAYRVADGATAWTHHLKPIIGQPVISTPLATDTARNEVAFGTGEGTPDVGIDASGHYGVRYDKRRLSRIVILDALSGTMVRSIDNIHADNPTALTISNDGRWFATGTVTGRIERTYSTETQGPITLENTDPVRIWSVESGALVKELAVHTEVQVLQFSPDGKYLVGVVSESPGHKNLRVWDVETGAVVQVLPTPREVGASFGLAFSPDGSRLVVAGQGIAILRYHPGH